jgi:hypothetical protein
MNAAVDALMADVTRRDVGRQRIDGARAHPQSSGGKFSRRMTVTGICCGGTMPGSR